LTLFTYLSSFRTSYALFSGAGVHLTFSLDNRVGIVLHELKEVKEGIEGPPPAIFLFPSPEISEGCDGKVAVYGVECLDVISVSFFLQRHPDQLCVPLGMIISLPGGKVAGAWS
jgi:hypothetical protein